MKLRTFVFSLLFAMLVTACGGSDTTVEQVDDPAPAAETDAPADDAPADTPATSDDTASPDEAADAVSDEVEDFAEDLVDDLEEAQEAAGGGSATLTVGDESWTFSPVLCAFGPEEIGQEGAEFVLSSIQDGMQMYVSIDSFGHSASLNDIEDFQNPRVSVSSFGGDFLTIDGKNFSGSADFFDDTSDSFETIPGSVSGTCP